MIERTTPQEKGRDADAGRMSLSPRVVGNLTILIMDQTCQARTVDVANRFMKYLGNSII